MKRPSSLSDHNVSYFLLVLYETEGHQIFASRKKKNIANQLAWQCAPVPLATSEHPFCKERGSQSASEPTLGEEKMKTHQEKTMGWLSSAKKAEGTMQEQIRESRAGHEFSTVQLSMP